MTSTMSTMAFVPVSGSLVCFVRIPCPSWSMTALLDFFRIFARMFAGRSLIAILGTLTSTGCPPEPFANLDRIVVPSPTLKYTYGICQKETSIH